MQIDKAREIIAVLMVTYPNYNPVDTELAAKTWLEATEEYSYEQVSTALGAYIKADTSGFAPIPSKIIDILHKMTVPAELNEMEAWSLVSKAIRNSGWHSEKEYENLPELVQKAVGSASQLRVWALDEDYNEGVIMSNFQRSYRVELKRHEELQKMPLQVRELIERVNVGSDKAKLHSKNEDIKRLEDKGNENI